MPVILPADDAPHHRLTEWWYYTGHLRDDAGGSWGFEFVVFRAERGQLPVAWASHLAFTDEAHDRFVYEERSEVGGPSIGRRRPVTGSTCCSRLPRPAARWLPGRCAAPAGRIA